MLKFLHARIWYVLGILLVVGVIVASLIPARDLPSMAVSDKFEHLVAYTALAIWFGGLLDRRSYVYLAAGLLLVGGAIEIAQDLMGLGRTAEARDFFAGGLGVLIGLGACLAGLRHWVSWIERWTRRR